jgi:hypothetical protein
MVSVIRYIKIMVSVQQNLGKFPNLNMRRTQATVCWLQYLNQELADKHFVYRAEKNVVVDHHLYQKRYPGWRCSDGKTFVSIHPYLCKHGNCAPHVANTGWPRSTTPEVKEDILDIINETPGISKLIVPIQVDVIHLTVWKVLQEQQLYSYHLQCVQTLSLQNYPAWVMFCQWFSQQCGTNPNFPAFLIFTDKARFTRDGI